jgi:hypothetical protein
MPLSGSSSRLRIAAVLFLLMAGFYWKLTLTRQYDWMSGPDLAEQVLPWFHVQAQEWHAGRIPLWDPYVWAGQPLLGQAQPGGAYPLNWILFALPLQEGHIANWALAWYFVVIHLMAAGFCYLFCRNLSLSRTASLAAGLIFSLSGYLGTTGWPQMINGAVWIPLVFLFQLRAARRLADAEPGRERKRAIANAALSGMFLGIAFLSGHHQIPIFTGLAWAGVWIYLLVKDRLLPAAALALIVTALTSALQTLPASEYGHLAKRWVGAPDALTWKQPVPYSVQAHYGLGPISLFGIVFPSIHTNFDPFVGVVAFSLALLAVAALWRDARVRLLGALGLGALLYTLAGNSVVQGALYAIIPELEKARTPSAAVVLFQFAAAALAAFAIDHLSAIWKPRYGWMLAGFGALTLATVQAIIFAHQLTFPADDRTILTGFFALAAAALFGACQRGALTASQTNVLLVLLLLTELGNSAQYRLMDRADRGAMQWQDKLRANDDVAEYLRKQPGFPRADVANDAFAANWGAWHGVEMIGGNGASVTANLLASEFFSLNGRKMYGVAYTLSKTPVPDAGDEVFQGASGLKVYRRDAFPRAWAVHDLIGVPEIGQGSVEIGRAPESFRNKAFVVGNVTPLAACATPSDKVQLTEHLPDRLTIQADMACDGMVVLSDTFFPGWRARVDGRAAGILEVNGAMRGVLVPKGVHTVTMRYRPASVYLGAGLVWARE